MVLNPHTILNNRYEIIEVVGQGSFSFVYRALDRNFQTEAAIKEFNAASAARFGRPDEMLKRFLQEARIIHKLNHPHIIKVYDLFSANGTSYIVMSYLPDTLANWLDRVGYLGEGEAVRLMRQICDGLAYAHRVYPEEKGYAACVVHCDVKPANVLLDQEQAKVADFGIAHIPPSNWGDGETLTTGGTFGAGTLYYMAPEQLDGLRDDPRIDVYALGALLYQMLTGRYYLDFDTSKESKAQARNRKLVREAPPLRTPLDEKGVSPELRSIILTALSKEPNKRYADAGEMLDALDKYAEHSQQVVHPQTELNADEAAEKPKSRFKIGSVIYRAAAAITAAKSSVSESSFKIGSVIYFVGVALLSLFVIWFLSVVDWPLFPATPTLETPTREITATTLPEASPTPGTAATFTPTPSLPTPTATSPPRVVTGVQFTVSGKAVSSPTAHEVNLVTGKLTIAVEARDAGITSDALTCNWSFDPPLPESVTMEDGACQVTYPVTADVERLLVGVQVWGDMDQGVGGAVSDFLNVVFVEP